MFYTREDSYQICMQYMVEHGISAKNGLLIKTFRTFQTVDRQGKLIICAQTSMRGR